MHHNLRTCPQSLPVFPLASALLLPTGQLPLNIFEPRYLQMVEDALSTNRMIGMIQPKEEAVSQNKPLRKTGCAGKIIEFSETSDGDATLSLFPERTVSMLMKSLRPHKAIPHRKTRLVVI